MRKPSENLTRQLSQLNLCSPKQLLACEKQVDRLSDGLPDFDSVWLDVLVQKQIISRFQANHLQQGTSAELKLESLTVREQLGERSFLAVTPAYQPIVIQRRTNGTEAETNALANLIETLDSKKRSAPTSLAVPIRLAIRKPEDLDQQVFVASRFHPGWTVAELLVRGGRLPWRSVLFICQQVLAVLEWMHAHGCSHGNINTSNVRVTPEGRIVLVGALGSRFADGGISLSANLQYNETRFIAPERILNLQPANFQSDLYSLAAVLWNLLAARDAFLTTDPINRITQAGQQNLPDIRSIVPDCPNEFAVAIQRFSKSNPQLRPANPSQAIDLIKAVGGGGRQGLHTLVKNLPDRLSVSLPAKQTASTSNLLATMAVACLMAVAFTAYGIQRGLIPSVASLTAPNSNSRNDVHDQATLPVTTVENTLEEHPVSGTLNSNRIRSLPSPDLAGVVVLESNRRYRASDLEFSGVMHIETSGSQMAQIIVSQQQTWNVKAEHLNLSNIHVIHQQINQSPQENSSTLSNRLPAPEFPAAVHVQANVVSIRKCVLDSLLHSQKSVCLHWSETGGTQLAFKLQDCVLRSHGSALSTSAVPQTCDFQNCLAQVSRSVLQATVPSNTTTPWRLSIHRVTQPAGQTFANFLMAENEAAPCEVIMTAGESVLAPTLALVQFAARKEATAAKCRVEFRLPERGNAMIVPPQITSAVAWDQSLKSAVAIASDNVLSDAILSAEPVFYGQSGNSLDAHARQWQVFELIDYDGPKLTTELPGIRLSDLPSLPMLKPTANPVGSRQ